MASLVSIIIPCRNEEKFIAKCLDSIIGQDYPKDSLEILVVDGMSEDKTREIVNKSKIQNPESRIQLIDNPEKYTPFAMNIGIRQAKGEIIMKMDSHTTYQDDYVSKCLFTLNKYKADNVGGILKALPSENTLSARAVALCLSHRFGMGNSYAKTGTKKIREVDTVAFGCFRKEIFKKVGLYDEKMVRSQDLELNLRLKKAGAKILLNPDIVGYYYTKPNLLAFLKQNLVDGSWVSYPLKFGKRVFSLRHLLPLFFVSGLFFLLITSEGFFCFVFALYLLVSFYFSIKISIKEKDSRLLFLMPIVFGIRHFGYGLGSLYGFFKIFKKSIS